MDPMDQDFYTSLNRFVRNEIWSLLKVLNSSGHSPSRSGAL